MVTGKRPPFSRRGEQAIQAAQEAALADAMPRNEVGDDIVHAAEARLPRARAEQYLKPAEPVAVSAGEAVTWENKADERFWAPTRRIVNTLEHPNSVSGGASDARVSAALAAGVLESAIDAAQSPQAENSIERMLCHQLAAAHLSAMRLLERVANGQLQPADVPRFTNAAARMMDVYQAQPPLEGKRHCVRLRTGSTERPAPYSAFCRMKAGTGKSRRTAQRPETGWRA